MRSSPLNALYSHTIANMAAIKRFFEKKKLDVKFKKAGTGHSLSSDSRGPVPSASHQSQQAAARMGPSASQQHAAEAAMMRIHAQSQAAKGDRAFKVLKLCYYYSLKL